MKFRSFLLSLTASILLAKTALAAPIDVNQKHPNDKKEYRTLRLANQIEVLLISDVSFNKSAAALDVGVGSHEDPKDKQGLAHFLEHVLFLGTKSFPEPDEFVAYLEGNQGNWNAYTAGQSTNYHFDINHDAFDGALKRFSLFFIEPTFDKKFVSKERNAVHSEYKKNLDSDPNRIYRVYQSVIKKGHPAANFSVGNQETLGHVKVESLIDFYKKKYSANIMKLVLMSNKPLNEMEKTAKKYFSPIKNTNYKVKKYDSEVIPKKSLPAVLNVVTIKDTKEIELIFPMASMNKYWKSKPHSILGHLLGHEGKGSLLSLLKKENLANAIYTSIPSSTYAATFETNISLTDHGLKNVDKIVSYFFSYINMVNKNGYKKYIYEEESAIRAINFVYRNQQEGVNVASGFANLMQRYPPLEIEKNQSLLHSYSKQDFNSLMKNITPTNLLLLQTSKNLKTDKKEHYFGTAYSLNKISKKKIDSWKKAPLHSELSYPEPNKFIPKKLELLSFKKKSPKKIIDSKWGVFWYQPDHEFKLPKASVQIKILSDKVNDSPKDKMMANLYNFSLNRSLEEWKYPITLAGLSFDIQRIDRGISLDFSGYSENIPFLIEAITKKLTIIDINEKTFEDVKDQLKRIITNSYKSPAYQQANYHLRYLTNSKMIHPKYYYRPIGKNEKEAIDMISEITLAQVKAFPKAIYNRIAIEGAAYGNLKEKVIAKSINQIPIILGSKVLPKNLRGRSLSLILKEGRAIAAKLDSTINNTSWVSNFQFGKRTAKLHATLAVGHAYLKASFFKELRTKQQLGYIVASWVSESDNLMGMTFLIQSDSYAPDELSQRAKAWMKDSLKAIKSMKKDEFEAYKKAVATKYRQKIKTIPERLGRIVFESFALNGKFGYYEEVAKMAESLTQKQMISAFENAFHEKTARSLSVYLSKKDGKNFKIKEKLIKDDLKFKAAAEYY